MWRRERDSNPLVPRIRGGSSDGLSGCPSRSSSPSSLSNCAVLTSKRTLPARAGSRRCDGPQRVGARIGQPIGRCAGPRRAYPSPLCPGLAWGPRLAALDSALSAEGACRFLRPDETRCSSFGCLCTNSPGERNFTGIGGHRFRYPSATSSSISEPVGFVIRVRSADRWMSRDQLP